MRIYSYGMAENHFFPLLDDRQQEHLRKIQQQQHNKFYYRNSTH